MPSLARKASDVKDTSLRVPPGMDGTVIDVRSSPVMVSRRMQRALASKKIELRKVQKDLDDQRRILEDDIYERIERMLVGKSCRRWPTSCKKAAR